MATEDARIAVGLPTHPKTKKLIKRLGQASAWNLVCLILWAAQNRSDGNLTGMSEEDIELAADWSGEDGAFVKALTDVRFLDSVDGEYVLHDWIEHNPWAAGADARSAKARWNAAKRHHGIAEADRLVPEYAAVRSATSNATSTDAAQVEHEHGNAPSPSPSPSPYPSPYPSPSPSPSPSQIPTSPSLRSGGPRAARKCPVSFVVTDELRAWASEKHPEIDAEAATEKFRDNTFKIAITDWPGAWRNWIRRESDFIGARPSARAESFRVQDKKAAEQRWAAFTGNDRDVIDVTPETLELEHVDSDQSH